MLFIVGKYVLHRGDQIFFSATCPGQVASKNPLVLKNFLLVPKYFSNRKSVGQIANTTISYLKCNSNQYMRGAVTKFLGYFSHLQQNT